MSSAAEPPGLVIPPWRGQRAHDSPERAIAAIAAGQHGIVTFAQLIGHGVSRAMVESRSRSGSLHRVHRGVYSVGHPPITREAWWLAAVFACGAGALLSYASAAALWGIRASAATLIDVSSPTRAGRRRDGIRVHRAANLTDADLAIRNAIPVTAVPRTIVDLATIVGRDALEYAIHRAEARRRVTIAELHAAIGRLPGHPGTAAVRSIVGRPAHELEARTHGRAEIRFLAICRRHRIPSPRVNEWIALPIASGGLEVDFCWPEAQLIVEVDERASHETTRAFRNDRARDRALGDAGWAVIRFAEEDLDRGDATAAQVSRRLSILGAV